MVASADVHQQQAEESSRKRERQQQQDDESDQEAEFELDDGGGAEPMQTEAANASASGATAQQITPEKAKAAAARAKEAAEVAKANETVFSPELLRTYYARLFPHELLTSWLAYDPTGAAAGTSNSLFARREWSFTIEPTPGDEIYIRYQSFVHPSDLTAAISKRNPHKIDIGAVFSHPPKDHHTLQSSGKFGTEQRELVFDIDLTDYDGVRSCGCAGAKICQRCWKMMTMAVKVMERGLREDFGFQHVAWFYSGRRGVHAWVCDESARTLSNEARSAVAAYFEISMGTDQNKGMNLSHPLHPMLSRAYDVLEPMFIDDILPSTGHSLLARKEQWEGLLGSLPPAAEPVAAALAKKWSGNGDDSTPAEKWAELKRYLSIFIGKSTTADGGQKQMKHAKNLPTKDRIKIEQWPVETVFRYTYPRLDINVSKMQNHLLKSPFCIHPKTGRVCVPIEVSKVDDFDPFAVPTLPQLMRELDEYEKQSGGGGSSSDGDEADGGDDDGSRRGKVEYDWQKTSLRGPFEHFQKQFLAPMWNELRRDRRAEAEEKAAMTGDF